MKVSPQEAAKNYRENGGLVVASQAADYIEQALSSDRDLRALRDRVVRKGECDRCCEIIMQAADAGQISRNTAHDICAAIRNEE